MSVTVSSAGKPPSFAKGFPLSLAVTEDMTVQNVKNAIASTFPKFYPARQKIALKNDRKALSDDAKLSELGVLHGGELTVKDLGPQVGWTTVFLVEYAGPLLIHPIFYHFSKAIYGKEVPHSDLQKYVYTMVLLHFAKRELETLFVHRFSKGTMPLFNIFKNSAHYHFLSGVLLAFDIYRPKFSLTSSFVANTIRDNPQFLNGMAAFWAWAELSNLWTHITVRRLRPSGSTKRAIPYGYGFSAPFNVSFPNYLFEIIGWATISAMTGSYAAWFFTAVSTFQMALWASKKHKAYKKEFGKEYPRSRKALIPYIF